MSACFPSYLCCTSLVVRLRAIEAIEEAPCGMGSNQRPCPACTHICVCMAQYVLYTVIHSTHCFISYKMYRAVYYSELKALAGRRDILYGHRDYKRVRLIDRMLYRESIHAALICCCDCIRFLVRLLVFSFIRE